MMSAVTSLNFPLPLPPLPPPHSSLTNLHLSDASRKVKYHAFLLGSSAAAGVFERMSAC